MTKSLECSGEERKEKSYDELIGIMKGYQKLIEVLSQRQLTNNKFTFIPRRPTNA